MTRAGRLTVVCAVIVAVGVATFFALRPYRKTVRIADQTVVTRIADSRTVYLQHRIGNLRSRIADLDKNEWQDHLAQQARIEWLCSQLASAEKCRIVRRNTPEDAALLRRHGVK